MPTYSGRSAILAAASAALMVGAVGVGVGVARDRGQTYRDGEEMRAREEIRQTHRISPQGTVRVRGIAGPVTVETTVGGDTAEVHIVRMAASERELQCYRTEVTSSPERLTIEHVQRERDRGCENIHSRQEVRLRVPRSVSLDFSTIAGALDVAPIDGRVRLDSIAGSTTLERVRTADISSIAGGLTIGLAPVAGEGIRISSIVGPVNLDLERGVDADLRVDSVMGSVRSLAPGADFVERHGTYHARVGAGGARVSLSSVVGPVRVRRP